MKPSIIAIHGVRLPVPEDSSPHYRRSLYRGQHERTLALFVKAALRPDDVVLEMGGGRGVLSTLCAKTIGSDRVFTFEANPALIPFIERVYAINAVRPKLVNAVVGTSEGHVPFYVCNSTDSSSAVKAAAGSKEILVMQEDVNKLLAEIKPTFILADIEGAEREVLKAATLDGVRTVAVEVHKSIIGEDGVADIESRLLSQGFRQNGWFSTSGRRLFERTTR